MTTPRRKEKSTSEALLEARALLAHASNALEPANDPRIGPVLREIDRAIATESGVRVRAGATGTEGSDRFLSAVCHDLKDPLAAVLMGAAFLLRTTPVDPATVRTRRMIEAIIRSGERMNALVRNLVDFTKLQRGRLDLAVTDHDVAALLESAVEKLEGAAIAKEVRIEWEAGAPLRVLCDAERFRHVVLLIAGNAIRYAPNGSVVTMRAAREDGFVRFSIIDGGPGMSPERVANLFDPYWHARQSPRDGTGLGIAIAKGFIEAQGGTVAVESAQGKGTTFSFTLPMT